MVVDTAVRVGRLTLTHPVMTAAGTSGHGAELSDFGDLAELGAVVVKSLSAFSWPGNPAPRLHPVSEGMLNAVGLQGSGIEHWAESHLGELARKGASVAVSIWGRSPEEYRRAAEMLALVLDSSQDARCIVAVEINLSCPNLVGHGIIAHDGAMSAEVIRQCRVIDRPLWAKLSPNSHTILDTARAVIDAGAEAITLINTVAGFALDERTGRSVLGNGAGGGVSGRAIHPIAVRSVHELRSANSDVPIIGVGGVTSAWEAAELMMVGANAVQVGTATFADPRAPFRIARDLTKWSRRRGIPRLADLTDLAHRGGFTQA